jgi:hypothetical protein
MSSSNNVQGIKIIRVGQSTISKVNLSNINDINILHRQRLIQLHRHGHEHYTYYVHPTSPKEYHIEPPSSLQSIHRICPELKATR